MRCGETNITQCQITSILPPFLLESSFLPYITAPIAAFSPHMVVGLFTIQPRNWYSLYFGLLTSRCYLTIMSGGQLTTRTYRTINPKTEAAHWLAYWLGGSVSDTSLRCRKSAVDWLLSFPHKQSYTVKGSLLIPGSLPLN